MRFPIRIEKTWKTTWKGVGAMLVVFIASLWLAVYFLNELQWFFIQEDARYDGEQYRRGWIRATSGDIHSDSTPEKTLEGFVEALRSGDVDAAMPFIAERFREEARAWFADFEAQGGDLAFLADYIAGMERRGEVAGEIEFSRPSLQENRADSLIYIGQDSDGQWRLTFSLH